ncbi:MAG: hypothetical protein LBQ59_04490 [Candidatus Peribacteria bacterium]|nr:hypothetical protein [Candidatus Peribacteria bacterium]
MLEKTIFFTQYFFITSKSLTLQIILLSIYFKGFSMDSNGILEPAK